MRLPRLAAGLLHLVWGCRTYAAHTEAAILSQEAAA